MKPVSILAPAAVAALVMVGPALAQSSASRTGMTDVVVTGGPPPKVVKSFPADGDEVAAGVLILKIQFDQPMTPQGWSYDHSADGAFPSCLERPRLLADQRTFVLLCTVAPHQAYAIAINAPPDFASAHGRSARTAHLHFSTSGLGVWDMHEALARAGLSDADEPIMAWRDSGAGVSRASAKSADPDDKP